MKKLIIAGPGNSGSGAVFDYFSYRDDFFIPLNDEFRLVNDPDGLQNLEESFYNNYSMNNSANAYNNFKLFCYNLSNFKSYNKGKLYPVSFHKIYKKFITRIIIDSYNGLPRFQRLKLNTYDKFKLNFLKIILKKNIKDIDIFQMIIPIKREEFIELSVNFIDKIIINSSKFNEKKICLIDQGVNIFNLESNLKFFSNSKCILTLRDPRGTYHTIKKLLIKNISYGYQGLEIDKFIPWYKNLYDKINSLDFDKKKVLIIKFEDFVLNHEIEEEKIMNFLQIQNKKTSFDIEKSKVNVLNLEHSIDDEDLNKIKTELKNYLTY